MLQFITEDVFLLEKILDERQIVQGYRNKKKSQSQNYKKVSNKNLPKIFKHIYFHVHLQWNEIIYFFLGHMTKKCVSEQ